MSIAVSDSNNESLQKLSFEPNRELLDSSFGGYKLSLEAVPVYSSELSLQDKIKPWPLSESQISFAHTKLAIDHNSNVIVPNEFTGTLFLLGRNSIHSISDRSQEHRRPETTQVWEHPPSEDVNCPDRYNPSLCFAGTSLAVYGDGHGSLLFLSLLHPSWKPIFNEEICGPNRPFIVLDACQEALSSKDLHVLIYYVDQSEKVSDSLVKDKSISVLEWMSFQLTEEEAWTLDRVRRYAFYGPLEKCRLSRDGKTVSFVTDKPFKAVFDSTLGEELSCLETQKEQFIIPTNEEITPAPFHWHQALDDITLWCLLPKGSGKRDIKVEFRPSFLAVSAQGESLLSGKLWNILESDSMSWTIKDRKLEINFCKVSEGMIWQRFLAEGPTDGDELSDPNAIDLIQSVLASREEEEAAKDDGGMTFNMNELEDVDSAPDSSPYLLLVDGDSSKTLGRGDLAGRQWLFNGPGPAFCIRHDVDGLIWELGEGGLPCHAATFSALGYVQASKQARKYSVFAPNFSFVAILDSSRHVYLYRQPCEIDSDLRNRKSGTQVKAIAKQSVITLEDTDEVIGAGATNTSVILVTHKRLICIKVR